MDQERETQSVIRLYERDYSKPELSDEFLERHDIIIHYNHNHDPRNGQFTSSLGGARITSGSVSKSKSKRSYRKRVKSLKKARKAREAKRAEEKKVQKSKEEILESKDFNEVLKNKDLFSNDELQKLLTRKNLESQIAEQAKRQTEEGKSRGQKILDSAKASVTEGAKSAANNLLKTAADKGLRIGVKALANATAGENEEIRKLVDQLLPGQYPKAVSDKSPEDARKQQILKSNNLSRILANKDMFTTKELQDAVARKTIEDKLEELSKRK